MNRGEHDFRITRDDFLGAIAMMRIEIPNRDPIRSVFQRIERGNCDVAEITKTHREVACGVMNGRAHETESAFSAQGRARRLDRCSGRLPGVLVDVWMRWCIEVEICLHLRN